MEISGSRNLNPPGFNWRSAFVCFSVEFFAFFMPSWDPPKITMDGDPIVGMTWITLTWKKTCLAILRVHVTRTHSRVSENVTNPTFGDQIKRSRRLNHLVLPVHFLGHNIKQKSWVLPPLRGWKQKLFKPPFGAPKSTNHGLKIGTCLNQKWNSTPWCVRLVFVFFCSWLCCFTKLKSWGTSPRYFTNSLPCSFSPILPFTPLLRLHPGRLTWNLEINHLERKMIWTKPPWLCSMLIFQGVKNVTKTPWCFVGWEVEKPQNFEIFPQAWRDCLVFFGILLDGYKAIRDPYEWPFSPNICISLGID